MPEELSTRAKRIYKKKLLDIKKDENNQLNFCKKIATHNILYTFFYVTFVLAAPGSCFSSVHLRTD